MTAINAFLYSDGAAIWTDAADYLADGTLMATCSKVQMLPHLRAVVAARGPSLFLPLIAQHLGSQFESFDALAADLSGSTRANYELHSRLFGLCDLGADFDLIVVGWSEAHNRPETWALFSHGRYGVEPWQAIQMGPVVIMPMDEPLAARLALTAEQLAGSLDPMTDGLRIIEEQRGVSAPQGGREEPSYGVGGFAQLTMLTRDGIATQIARRWPDEIGQKLGPT